MPPADSVTGESAKRHQLALLLHHLGHAVGVVDATSQQDGSDSCGVQSSNTVNGLTDSMDQLESKDGLYTCKEEISDVSDLTAALHELEK